MTLQRLLVLTICIENVDLGVVQGNNNVLAGQMQACDHTLVRGNMLAYYLTTLSPSRFNHILLLKVRPVGCSLWSALL